MTPRPRLTLGLLSREPFRLFFPLAVLVGLAGVALWPLYFASAIKFYPGQSHARSMAYGFFGGFIVGFLGTALPRMVSAKPFRAVEVGVLLLLYTAMAAETLWGNITVADTLFLVWLAAFAIMLLIRLLARQDVPPPSFVLVALGLGCAGAGAVLSILVSRSEEAFFWAALQHLLAYQGFLLLPILGVGAFLLPRFFDLPNRQNFPESKTPPPGWTAKALIALVVGVLILATFWIEAGGWVRTGPALRLAVTALYFFREVPLHKSRGRKNTPGAILMTAFVLMLGGFVAIVVAPGYRVPLLHLTLIGGFAIITLAVATRVIFGHSGHARLLEKPNRWFWVVVALMILAMITRISGDFWTKVMASHYSYGAVVWMTAVLIWTVYVLPKVLTPDPEE